MEYVLPYLVVLLSLVALFAPVWLCFISKREETHESDLEIVVMYISYDGQEKVLRNSTDPMDIWRILLYVEVHGGNTRI